MCVRVSEYVTFIRVLFSNTGPLILCYPGTSPLPRLGQDETRRAPLSLAVEMV